MCAEYEWRTSRGSWRERGQSNKYYQPVRWPVLDTGVVARLSAAHLGTSQWNTPACVSWKERRKKELHTLHNVAFMLGSHNGASSFTHVLIVLPWMRKGCSLQTARLSSSVVPANSHPCCPLSSASVCVGGRGTEWEWEFSWLDLVLWNALTQAGALGINGNAGVRASWLWQKLLLTIIYWFKNIYIYI